MPSVAVLADIHGNLPALEAVLDDIEKAGVDLIVLNGDLADGPFPAETLDRLAGLGNRAVWLRGNGDRWLAEARDGRFKHPDPPTDAIIQWASRGITDAQAGRLASLPLMNIVTVMARGSVGFCHATGRSDNEMFLVDSSLAQAEAAFAAFDTETVVVGHCHMPFDRLINGRRFVNAGSVGMPYGHSGAAWALIGRDVVLRRTDYDVEAAAARITMTGMPGADAFIETYIRTTPSDVEALDAYREIVLRQQATMEFG